MTAPARPRVAVIHNEPALPPDHPDYASEADVVAVAGAVVAALQAHGFDAAPVPVGPPIGAALGRLLAHAPDLVFNLMEGFAGRSQGAIYATALLELAGLPYTGSPTESLAACQSKGRAKALLRGLGLPTADFVLLGEGEAIPKCLPFPFPVMVKPDEEDGSLGIDQESVVTGPAGLASRVSELRSRYGGAVLIEGYLPGPEFNLGVLALPRVEALPVAEIVYAPRTEGWPILTYEAKWVETSAEDKASVVVCPAAIERTLAVRLSELAEAAFSATACRDYARVDFRLDARGEPTILEVNPNPDIGPAAGLARAARMSGLSYDGLIAAVARHAWRRGSPGASVRPVG